MHIYKSPFGALPIPEQDVFSWAWSNPYQSEKDKPAYIDARCGTILTRGSLYDQATRLAYGLVHRFHLKAQDVVAVFSLNSLEYPIIVHACQCAGLVVSGANAAYMPDELAHQLREASAKILFCHPDLYSTARKAVKVLGWTDQQCDARVICTSPSSDLPRASLLSSLLGYDHLAPVKITNVKDTVGFLCFSSGTTSAPKGVMTTHHNMIAVCTGLAPLKYGPKDVFMGCVPFSHIYGLTHLCIMPVYLGATTIILPKFDAAGFCQTAQKYKGTLGLIVPPMLLSIIRLPNLNDYDLSSLRYMLSGGANLPLVLQQEFEKIVKVPVVQGYGMTECSPSSHCNVLGTKYPDSCGPLLPNVEARFVDVVSLEDVPVGSEGELWIAGALVTKGYLNRPEATSETIVQGRWLRTGDIGFVKDDHLWISDRVKEMIKYKALQVFPAEIEAVLMGHPQIADAGVIGAWSDAEATELPRAYVSVKTPVTDAGTFEKEVQDYVATRLANHKRLRGGVLIIDEIPRSPSGKILRRVLKARGDPPPTYRGRASKL